MRDYQRKKNNKYRLPSTVYYQTLWTIRDYKRMLSDIDDIANTATAIRYDKDKVMSSPSDDMVPNAADKISQIKDKIRAIDRALEGVPEEYRDGIWNNITLYKPYPQDAGRATYGRWKSFFVYKVAENLKII